MESGNGALCGAGRIVEADFDLPSSKKTQLLSSSARGNTALADRGQVVTGTGRQNPKN